MVCTICGATLNPGARYCSACGTRCAVPVPMRVNTSVEPRVERHLRLLALLWSIAGWLWLVMTVFGGCFVAAMLHRPEAHWNLPNHLSDHGMAVICLILFSLIAFLLSGAVLAISVGYGLSRRRPWARTLAMIVGVLALLKFPLGTMLGAFTLWVLAPAQSRTEYEALSEV